MQRYYSLKEVISSLQHTFVNIDIRGVVAKKSERADESNECDDSGNSSGDLARVLT